SVVLLRTTIREPSTIFATILASATAKAGGISKITISYIRSASRKMSRIFFDDNNSAGFGGIGPQDNTYKSSTSVVSIASSKSPDPTNTLLNPVKLFKRNV